jgi:DNA gyrase subunit B
MSNIENKVEHNYSGDQIQVLEGLEAVRKRPGMYVGSTGPAGLHHLVYEIVDNSIDEALAGYCDHIEVEILPGNVIRVTDNGRGVPVGIQPKTGIPAVTVVFTILHAGGKFGGENSGYKVSGGLHGVGASVVNALSRWMKVTVYNGEGEYTQSFKKGKADSKLVRVADSSRHGTVVEYLADSEIFENVVYDWDTLEKRLREQAFLNRGLRITLTDRRSDKEKLKKITMSVDEGNQKEGENPHAEEKIDDEDSKYTSEDGVKKETMMYDGGISSFVEYLNRRKNPIHPVIHFKAENEENTAEVALQYRDDYSVNILSFANNIHTGEGGTHETGFKTALTTVMNKVGRAKNYIKENEDNLDGNDVREGLTAIISVKVTEAQFEGQTKTKLGNTEMGPVVSGLVMSKMEEYLEENPAVARVIFEKMLAAQRARIAARKARETARRKTALNSARMPEKLYDCSSKDPKECEIYIVEGDSAGGSAKNGRDRHYQAVLPLWGKMLNVEKARVDRVYNNEKLSPVVQALGCGIGSDIDLDKLRYHKVVIMADADVDGQHIRTLLLTFFFRFMRPLIENGHVYIALPPLYKVQKGKKIEYAYDEEERDAMDEKLGGGSKVSRYKGLGEMSKDQLWDTTMNPATRKMIRVTLEDAQRADEVFTVLMGDKVAPRRTFIERNAKYATNIDF